MDSHSRLGRQPFQGIVQDDGRTLAWVARTLGVDYSYVIRVAAGRTAPTSAFRSQLTALLDEPPERLFTPEALDAHYDARRNSIAPLDEEVRA